MDILAPKIVLAIAGPGLLVSLIVHGLCVVDGVVPPSAVSYALHLGVVVASVLALSIAPNPTTPRPWSRSELRRAMFANVPLWMQIGIYCLLAYCFVQFFQLVLSAERPVGGGFTGSVPFVRLFSSNWLLLYFSSFAIAASAPRRERRPE